MVDLNLIESIAEKNLKEAYEERQREEENLQLQEEIILNITINNYERQLAKVQAEQIEKYYAFDRWKNLFNKMSFYNDIPCQILFHAFLGQLLCKKRIMQTANFIDFRIHFLWLQDCLDEKTSIYTDKGMKKLFELPENFKVLSHNFEYNVDEWKNSIKIESGSKEVYEIELENGEIIRASENHILFRKDGQEIKVKNLKEGDELFSVDLRGKYYRTEKTLEIINKHCREIMNDKNIIDKIRLKIKERWNNPTWVEKEMKRRKELVNNGNYKKRQEKNPRRGMTWEEQYGKQRTETLKNNLGDYMRNHNPMINPMSVNKLRVPNKKKGRPGRLNPSYGKVCYPARVFVEEVGFKVKSSWEKECILLLLRNDLPIRYETELFHLKNTTYTPDFKINDGVYLEVKGAIYDKSILKYKEFLQKYKKRLIFLTKDSGTVEKLITIGFETYLLNDKRWIKICKNLTQ